jgi:hypothetical protein
MKLVSFLIGLILISVIVYFGYYTVSHPGFVVWFGVITAVVSPLAFEFLLIPFRSKDSRILKELSKVPQVQNLLQSAKDSE